uniref:hypothetical protein n=1 Tax=Candidatus Fimivicinus sp. TaxID=3056640 RepID=UPI003FED5464
MKKAISLVLTIILLVCTFHFIMPTYATSLAEEELNLAQYTLEDLAEMSADEYRQLLANFERVYDPFNTYDTNPIMEENKLPAIQPRWGSGDLEKDETGSHEMITARACSILMTDKGFFSEDGIESFAMALTISLASIQPDKDEVGALFAGHFYHAIDGDNYLGSKSNTALTNCRSHYNAAVSAAKRNDKAKAMEEIGRALHYLQDAGQPHHAANITVANLSHKLFEDQIDANIDTYINLITSVNNHNFHYSTARYTYSSAAANSVDYLVKSTSIIAYGYRTEVNNALNKSKWDFVARITVPNSIAFSALLMYKFAGASGWGVH